MPESIAEWTIHHEQSVFAAQRVKADAAKVVVGLTLAVASTLVGTALQVDPVTGWDVAACVLLAGAVVLAVATVGLDHVEPCDRRWFEDRRIDTLPPDYLARYIAGRLRYTTERNESVLALVLGAVALQVAFSVLSGISAVLSLVAR